MATSNMSNVWNNAAIDGLDGADGQVVNWIITQEFTLGEFCYYEEKFYDCLITNTGNQPDTSPTYWKELASAPGTTWNTDSEYFIGDLVWYSDIFWESKVDNNTGNTPAEDANWTSKGGLGSEIKDFDFEIGSVSEYMGETPIPTGKMALTTSNQALTKADYPKLWNNLGSKYGSDALTFNLPTIAQASGAEYIQDWSLCTGWTAGASITINHDFGVAFDEYDGKILVRDPASPTKIFNATNIEEHITGTYYGQRLNGIVGDLDNCEIQILSTLGLYIATNGASNAVPTTWEYKVTLTKDSPLPADVTLCMYVGNGSLSVATDSGVDTRLTDIENTLALSVPPYDTGWINRSSWNNVHLGSSTTKNVDSNVAHGFNTTLDKLGIEVLISPDGTDASSFKFYTTGSANNSTGISFYQVSLNEIKVQTGSIYGDIYTDDSGVSQALNIQDWYYKIVVTKHQSLAFISAQNSFINHKDWVEIWGPKFGDSAVANATVTKYLPDGNYRVILSDYLGAVGNFHNSFITVDRDNGVSAYGDRYTNAGSSTAFINIYYTYADNTLNVSATTWTAAIYSIERWETVTGETKDSVQVSDGYETLWEDWSYASTFKFISVERGHNYRVTISNDVQSDFTAYIFLRSDGGAEDYSYGSYSVNERAYHRESTQLFDTGIGGMYLKKIEKQLGYIAIDVTHTREKISGTAVKHVLNVTPTGADTSIQSYLDTLYPTLIAGDEVMITNTGVGGFLLTDLPDGLDLPNGDSITFNWSHSEQVLYVDNSALFGRFVDRKDWVELWKDYSATSQTKVFTVPDGDYKITILGANSFTSYVTVDRTSGKPSFRGPWTTTGQIVYTDSSSTWATDIASNYIAKIERWEDTSGADRPSLPIDEGWETVYDEPANTADVTLLVPNGFYRISVSRTSGLEALVVQTTISDLVGSIVYCSIGSSSNLSYTRSSGLWTTALGSDYDIKKIERHKGTMHLDVYNTRSHTTGTPNMYIEEYDTTSADFDFTARLAVINALTPQTGDYIRLSNYGSGNENLITNAPDGGVVGQGDSSLYFYSSIQGQWVKESGGALGVNQTWQDVKASRASGVIYTNETGRPIQVLVSSSGSSHTASFEIDGLQISFSNTTNTSSIDGAIVPSGSTYEFTGTATIALWSELR